MKKILIDRINPCCLLSYSDMLFWINNLTLNDPDGSLRELIRSYLLPNGQLKTEGWQLISQTISLVENSPITHQNIYDWGTDQDHPTCNQLKQIIENVVLEPNVIPILASPLSLVEADIETMPVDLQNPTNFQRNIYLAGGLIIAKFFTLRIKNFDLIKDANPYLVIERFVGGRKKGQKKFGWRRAKPMEIGQSYYNGWNHESRVISFTEMYRPNEIPLTSEKQLIDIVPENYIRNSGSGGEMPEMIGDRNKRKAFPQSDGNVPFWTVRVPIRLRIGYRLNNKEYLSAPLTKFCIFAQRLRQTQNGDPIFYVTYGE